MLFYHSFKGRSCPYEDKIECSYDAPYRKLDGSCNNLKHPKWGSFGCPLKRILQPQYEDGYHMPRGAKFVKEKGYLSRLPSPRKVSAKVFLPKNVSDGVHTHALMQFGQFIDHDLASTVKNGEYFLIGSITSPSFKPTPPEKYYINFFYHSWHDF